MSKNQAMTPNAASVREGNGEVKLVQILFDEAAIAEVILAALRDVQRETTEWNKPWMQHTRSCQEFNKPHSDGEADFRQSMYHCIASCGLSARLQEITNGR